MAPIRRPVLALVAVLATAAPAAAQEPPAADFEQVVDLTFPTDPRARFQDDYHHARSGGRHHQATDLMGDKGWPIYAAVGGTVCFVTGIDEPPPSYGYMLRICGDDGRSYSYVHINNDTPGTDDGLGGPENAYAPGIRDGARVERGQFVAYVGDSGNAESTAPHLHFEIRDPQVTDPYGGDRIDPYFSLVDALERGDVVEGSAPPPPSPVERVAGPDRVGTAIELSRAAFVAAPVAVVAPAETPAEAIVAGPLAYALHAPVLLTGSGTLDARVRAELDRLGVGRVVLVGLDLPLDGYESEVVAGPDRFATAALVAARVREVTGVSDTLVALGSHPDPARSWPDSLVASYLGSLTGTPVLLVAHDALPEATARALDGTDDVTIVGGEAAVPRDVADAVDGLVDGVDRLAGATRYTTATAVADAALATGRVSAADVWAATGRNWPDAVAAGPAVATAGDVLVLVDGEAGGRDADARPWLDAQEVASARVIGGPVAVSDAAARALAAAID